MNVDLEITTSDRASQHHAGRWLHRVLTQLAQQAARDIHKVPQWEEHGIHSLRKRMKKLQAMLRFAKPVVPVLTMKSVLGEVRDLKNLLSGQRDTLVITKLAHKLKLPVAGIPTHADSTQEKVSKAIALSEQLQSDIGLLDLSQLTWKMVGDVYTSSYKASRKAWRKAQEEPTVDNLHKWRKKVKRLYYQSTSLEHWLHHPKRLRRTRKLGSLLGDCHDLDVFSVSMKSSSLQAKSGWESKVEDRRDQLLSRVEHRAEKAFSRPLRKIKSMTHHALP